MLDGKGMTAMKTTQRELISQRLKEARDAKGETQKQVGEVLNVSRGAISGYETGQRMPSIEMMCDFAHHYDEEIGYLLGMDAEIDKPHETMKSDLIKLKYLVKNRFLDLSPLSTSGKKEILRYYNYLRLCEMNKEF